MPLLPSFAGGSKLPSNENSSSQAYHKCLVKTGSKSSNQCCQITYNCCQRGRAGNQPAMSCDYPTKGTPQGGILYNIVLNELDWWVASQWENMPTHYEYKTRQNSHVP